MKDVGLIRQRLTLAGAESIAGDHVAEALQFRMR